MKYNDFRSNVFKEEDDLSIRIDGTDIVKSSSKFYENLKELKTSLLHKSLINGIFHEYFNLILFVFIILFFFKKYNSKCTLKPIEKHIFIVKIQIYSWYQ